MRLEELPDPAIEALLTACTYKAIESLVDASSVLKQRIKGSDVFHSIVRTHKRAHAPATAIIDKQVVEARVQAGLRRAYTPYNIYVREVIAVHRREGIGTVFKRVADSWKALDDNERALYVAQALRENEWIGVATKTSHGTLNVYTLFVDDYKRAHPDRSVSWFKAVAEAWKALDETARAYYIARVVAIKSGKPLPIDCCCVCA